MEPVRVIIQGEAASKANSRQLVTNRRTGRPMVIKSAKARAYEKAVAHQVPRRTQLLVGPLVARIRIYYASNRPDLDESLILDCLQGRIYSNDRQIVEKHVYKSIDRNKPRSVVEIEPLQSEMAV